MGIVFGQDMRGSCGSSDWNSHRALSHGGRSKDAQKMKIVNTAASNRVRECGHISVRGAHAEEGGGARCERLEEWQYHRHGIAPNLLGGV